MTVAIEHHVDWVADCCAFMDANGHESIEPTETAETAWTDNVRDVAEQTLLPPASSWYMGASVPGRHRMFYVYIGGFPEYRKACDDVVRSGYSGFRFDHPQPTTGLEQSTNRET